MELFRNGRTSYVAIAKETASKRDALIIANRYFKTSKDNLVVKNGTVKGDSLAIGRGNHWVIARKEHV